MGLSTKCGRKIKNFTQIIIYNLNKIFIFLPYITAGLNFFAFIFEVILCS